ncbi:16S rRNA (cytidine(1402)-2'-O)-methyltransferase [Candidatus Parcubacteria bacterium]|nr:16S rRNA (cytidine(1402)-2'-O)-methyltransferase [Patescibacteria group bacterium]MBU4466704.1 16S rRNA (cytidine(1402)-2'-O)-methyltransferase [Patescibacteria group bacterium]MCG2688027.1 16S rRNA (cytidine(1402)-2'-O)-methyltransferase [Candidatus Parcubacteria bacterium]
MAVLYIVATPIGNLQDISSRAIEVLKGVDLILAEDTRVTKKLLARYQIRTKTISYHQHSRLEKIDYFLDLLKRGKDLALVSDAGTPGVSDPGNMLIKKVVEVLGDKIVFIPIPGPSALAAAASISGFPMERFLFLGFPPQKKKRKRFFEEIIASKYPVIFYESRYRLLKTLEELNSILNTKYQILNTRLVICQELTKMFEKTYRGTISEVLDKIKDQDLRGEFVIILSNQKVRKDE